MRDASPTGQSGNEEPTADERPGPRLPGASRWQSAHANDDTDAHASGEHGDSDAVADDGLSGPPARVRTNALAMWAFACGIIGLGLGIPLAGFLGIYLAMRGRRQIERSNGAQKGRGLATAALVLNVILVAWYVLAVADFAAHGFKS